MSRGTAADTSTPDPPDPEGDYELVTSARQLGPPPALRSEAVILHDWKTASGKSARLMLWELTAGDYAAFMEEGRVYKDGAFVKYDQQDEDIRFLSWAIRDQHGNRLWHDTASARAVLGGIGKATLNVMLNAGNRCNAPKDAGAEGNSETDQSGS